MKKRKGQRGQKSKPWVFLASLLLFVVGAGIFLYPLVSNLMAERLQEQVIRTYTAKIEETRREELDQAREDAEIYNENLAGDPVHDPFVSGSGYALPDNYEEVLDLNEDGVMGYVEIPNIDVRLPIYHGVSKEVLEKGAGHIPETSLPIGGENTHAVISAHRGLPSAKLFTRLDEMKKGNVFYLYILDEILAYQVDEIQTILPEDIAELRLEKGKDLVTLLTCTPYGENTHRLLVRGIRIPYKETKETQASKERGTWLVSYIVTAVGGVTLLVVAKTMYVKKKRRSQ